ncbi:hypothetical protein PR202_ga27681 [Eleusine coracana subsp. coracana]|uniref:FAD-binding PCMH-type domain-containing protein n=1 Tax=Eleusine coracana subsp. coracana TaxID=191504 RepID=A0AAV5DHH3_ELECO|nr:hypothetical protein PR202_ga27681 [Eleusine coracana subsp. coracana]
MFHNCTVSNAQGTFNFNDRKPCRAAEAVYPRTEAELVAAVASVVREKRKVKASTAYSHSFPKLACPGGDTGTIISTARLNRVVSVDAERNQITVESGMILKDLFDAAAAAGMALPNSPYFYGLTIGGLLATGAHGTSLMRKGGAVHEHVIKVRIVTPAPPSERIAGRLAIVREIGADDPDLNAAKVSLGVLGVISQVTLQLDPLFKRSLTILRKDSDADLVELVSTWGHKHEFGDMYWLPGQRKVLLGQIDRVDVSTPGDGLNQAFFPPRPISDVVRERSQEDQLQEDSAVSVTLAAVPAFISDLMRLRDRNPKAFCTLDLHLGILFRYIKGSTAYLGKTHDSVEFDLIYYRSREPGRPIMHADLIDEIEQIALCTSMLVCRIGARTGTTSSMTRPEGFRGSVSSWTSRPGSTPMASSPASGVTRFLGSMGARSFRRRDALSKGSAPVPRTLTVRRATCAARVRCTLMPGSALSRCPSDVPTYCARCEFT